MKIIKIPVGLFQANCYITTLENGEVYVIDPGGEAEKILSHLNRLDTILLTHTHFDHIGALKELKEVYPKAKLCMHENCGYSKEEILAVAKEFSDGLLPLLKEETDDLPNCDLFLKDKDKIGPFEVIYTPGHSKGSVCYYSKKDDLLFSGDTLFQGSIGRCDLLGSNFDSILESLNKILALPDNTKVLPGHGEATFIKEEK
ncbi:MAG: MBL fold metallo-hydrolase [Sphaerochaetaceae bacterium]